MIYFFGLYFLLIILFAINEFFYKSKIIDWAISFISLTMLLLIFGLRTIESTPDAKQYLYMIHNPGDMERIEFLYQKLSYILNLLSLTDQQYIFILYCIPVFILYFCVLNNLKYRTAFVFLFISLSFSYLDLSTNLIRQFYATVIWIVALLIVNNRSLIKNILILSTFFIHVSFIIPIVMTYFSLYWSRKRYFYNKNNISIVIIFVTVLGLGVIMKFPLGNFIVTIVEFFNQAVIGIDFLNKIAVLIKIYFNSSVTFGSLYETTFIARFYEVISIVLPLYLCFYIGTLNYKQRFLITLYTLLVVFYLLMSGQALSYRYSYFAYALLPFYLINFTKRNIVSVVTSVVILLIMLVYVNIRLLTMNYNISWIL